jgi:CRP-like cAMP-binding protein
LPPLPQGHGPGGSGRDGTVIDWGLPQTDLAHLCGDTRANVSRVLAEFGRRQLIQRSGRQYILRDVNTLRRLAGL